MDLMAEIKLNSDYKRASAAPVWLKGGNVLNGHYAQQVGDRGRAPPPPLCCIALSTPFPSSQCLMQQNASGWWFIRCGWKRYVDCHRAC